MTLDPLQLLLPPSLGELRASVRRELLETTLRESLGRPVLVRVAGSYDELGTHVRMAQAHLAWAPPQLCAQLAGQVRHLLAARRKGRVSYASALVVRAGEGLDLGSLRGRRAAWVDSRSTGGHLLAKGWLRAQGLDPDELFGDQRFHGSYLAALRAVLGGQADLASVHVGEPAFGAVRASLVEHLGRDAGGLEALAVTGTTPSDALLITQALPADEAARLRDLFVSGQDPGAQALAHACAADGFVEVAAPRYDLLRPARITLPPDCASPTGPGEPSALAIELERLASFPLLNPSPVMELNAGGEVGFLNPAARHAFPDAADWSGDHPFVALVRRADREAGADGDALQADLAVEGRRYHVTCTRVAPGLFRLYTADVTARWQAQQALRSADRLVSVGTMAAGVAHELNNPLAWLSANLEVLAESQPAPSDWPDLVSDCLEATRRMARIVQGFRGYSREDDSRRPDVDLIHVVRAALRIVGNEVRHRAHLTLSLDPAPPVDASENQLIQVVLNLVVNALQAFGGTPGALHLSTGEDADGRARLVISDNGPGIPPEQLEEVWRPFYTTKPVGEGTGLGLSICRSLVEAHDGTIRLASTPGKGTEIEVLLPRSRTPARPVEVPTGPRLAPKSARVLVIDDEPGIGRVVRRILTGHRVLVCPSAEDALTVLEEDRSFDLVLCDVMMPGFDGVQLYGLLHRQWPDLAARVVFMTGGAFSDGTRSFLDATQVPCLGKPFSIAELRDLVAERVAGARARA